MCAVPRTCVVATTCKDRHAASHLAKHFHGIQIIIHHAVIALELGPVGELSPFETRCWTPPSCESWGAPGSGRYSPSALFFVQVLFGWVGDAKGAAAESDRIGKPDQVLSARVLLHPAHATHSRSPDAGPPAPAHPAHKRLCIAESRSSHGLRAVPCLGGASRVPRRPRRRRLLR